MSAGEWQFFSAVIVETFANSRSFEIDSWRSEWTCLDFGADQYACLEQPKEYSRIPLTRITWNDESSGYAENPDNGIFL